MSVNKDPNWFVRSMKEAAPEIRGEPRGKSPLKQNRIHAIDVAERVLRTRTQLASYTTINDVIYPFVKEFPI